MQKGNFSILFSNMSNIDIRFVMCKNKTCSRRVVFSRRPLEHTSGFLGYKGEIKKGVHNGGYDVLKRSGA